MRPTKEAFVAFSRIRSSNVENVDQRSTIQCFTRPSILPQTETEEGQTTEAEEEEEEVEDQGVEDSSSANQESPELAAVKRQ